LLRIRLTRTGKKRQPSYRIVVAEHTAPIKGRYVELVGYYNQSRKPRELEVDQDRVKHWISVGAKPTDTVAGLLKSLGMDGMDKYIEPRNKKRKKKKETPEETGGGSAEVSEAPAEEAKEEAPAEETKEEAPAEEAKEEAPAEEAKEEAPAEETKDEAPAEEAKDEAPAEDKTS